MRYIPQSKKIKLNSRIIVTNSRSKEYGLIGKISEILIINEDNPFDFLIYFPALKDVWKERYLNREDIELI